MKICKKFIHDIARTSELEQFAVSDMNCNINTIIKYYYTIDWNKLNRIYNFIIESNDYKNWILLHLNLDTWCISCPNCFNNIYICGKLTPFKDARIGVDVAKNTFVIIDNPITKTKHRIYCTSCQRIRITP